MDISARRLRRRAGQPGSRQERPHDQGAAGEG